MHNILLQIIEKKKKTLPVQAKEHAFKQALLSTKDVAVIAEIKFASPTEKNLGNKKELLKRAKNYETAGATAISLITEKQFFKGETMFVSAVKKEVALPVLQKDFVIAESQIYEAKSIGSDALLLIARLLDAKKLQRFVLLTRQLGITPVVEINNEEDLQKTLGTKTEIIAVNARDLETFKIDIDNACLLMKKIPDKFIVLGFSGIKTASDVRKYKQAGARGVLVGTSLMQANNVTTFLKGLRI